MNLTERIADCPIPSDLLCFRDQDSLSLLLKSWSGARSEIIGQSRQNHPLFGVTFGSGPKHVSIIAGCHADEPIGPMTAQLLFPVLSARFSDVLESFTFHVIPQMNPDGAEQNRPWFGDPLSLTEYLNQTIRELPGDDIEFGFGEEGDERPECVAMQSFLRPHGPYVAHLSLHGLAIAEGAWCLVCREWEEKGVPFMEAFSQLCAELDFPQHDIDRHGEKGFVRYRKGFTSTPHSVPMQQHFLALGDPDTAALFKPSSMQWVQSLGGDPLCVVSELPLFLLDMVSPSLDDLYTTRLKEEISSIRATKMSLADNDLAPLIERYRIQPTPLELQVRLQLGMILLALQSIA
jgi:Zinc carboxypeptidase